VVYLIDIRNKDFEEPLIQNLELGYLASSLLINGYDVQVIDCKGIHNKLSLADIEAKLVKERPDSIVFYTKEFTYKEILILASALKLKFEYCAILVGPWITFGGSDIMKNNIDIDFAIYGNAITKLVKVLNGDFSVSGIIYRKANKIISNKVQVDNLSLDCWPFPIREIGGTSLLTQTEVDGEACYIVPMRSSRGCMHKCTFCTVPIQSRKNNIIWSIRSKENLLHEIEILYKKYRKIDIRFLDENFSESIERVMDITKAISNIGNVEFSFTARVSTILKFDASALSELYSYGVRGIEVGVENFNDSVLERYKKGHTSQEAVRALRNIRKSGINIGIDFIMFDPWTTINELKHNLEIIRQEGIDTLGQPIIYNFLYPYTGTPYKDTINMNSYFQNVEISEIYQKLKLFKNEWKEVYNTISANRHMLDSLVLLKAPYNFLEELIRNPFLPLRDSMAYRAIKSLLINTHV